MILWGKPLWLLALLVPVALFIIEIFLRKRDRSLVKRFASLSLWPRLAPGQTIGLVRAKRWLFVIALLLLALAIANPRIGTRYEEVVREGIDIVLAVDVSRSMDSQDIRPSRIGKARYELARFIEGMKGDRVGIVPFAGTAYPLLPLTLDYAAAKMFVDLLDAELIPNAGTDLAAAIETSAEVFTDEKDRAKVIVLVSDGEDHEGDAVDAAKEAASKGIRIFTIGMAKEKGDPIPVFNEAGQRTGWLTDEEGQIVTSRLNEEILREIARAGNGEYRRADQGGNSFRALYRELFQLERGEFEAKQITGHEDRFQPLILAALILLLVQFFLPDVRKKNGSSPLTNRNNDEGRETMRRSSPRPTRTTTTAILLLAFATGLLPGASTASAEIPHKLVKKGNKEVIEKNLDDALEHYLRAQTELDTLRPELIYNLGGVYARKGEAGRADTLFRSLGPEADEELRARADYNRGTTLAEAQQYEQAVQALIDALKKNPQDEDAKINLELALRKQQQQQQQQKQDQNQDQQKQDKQDQQKKNEDQGKQDQQNPDQQQEEEKNPENQPQQDEQQKPKNQDQQQQPQQMNQNDLNKEMAERLLNQMQQDEKEQLKQVIRQQVPVKSKGKTKPW